MGYLPKRLVNTNLFTAGGEYLDASTGQPYEGAYHENFNGEAFTGKDQYDPNSKPLIRNPRTGGQSSQVLPSSQNRKYAALNPNNQDLYRYGADPSPMVPILTGDDYKRGRILRYFARKRNQTPTLIIEIDQEMFDDISKRGGKYNYTTWAVFNLYWKITGPLYDSRDRNGVLVSGIVDTNRRIVDKANEAFRGIKQYLTNLIEYSVKPDLELVSNLYATRGQLTVKLDNSAYEGYYHVMADGTIMDGATHTQSTGKTLLAGDVLIQSQISTLVKDALSKLGAT